MFSHVQRRWNRIFGRKQISVIRTLKARRRVFLEHLEQRSLLATITVTSLEDNVTVDGLVTLREAIDAANSDISVDGSVAGSGADAVNFSPTLYAAGDVSISLGQSTASPNGGLTAFTITSPITIQGPAGSNGITLNANDNFRHFDVTSAGALTLQNLTIIEGNAAGSVGNYGGGGGAGMGGAIFIDPCVAN